VLSPATHTVSPYLSDGFGAAFTVTRTCSRTTWSPTGFASGSIGGCPNIGSCVIRPPQVSSTTDRNPVLLVRGTSIRVLISRL
jgi:hypothetical protein